MAITVLDWAKFRGVNTDAESISMAEFDRVGLPMIGGCHACGATVGAGNACPTKHGYLACAEGCVGDDGYDTADEANRDNFPEEYGWLGVQPPASDDLTD